MTELSFEATKSSGRVSALFLRPDDARWLYVFAHGAGTDMRHKSMQAISESLAEVGVATFRYNFPYMEARSGAPNPKPILTATVRSAVMAAAEAAPDLSLLAGGRSMGGRMTSQAASEEPLPRVRGLVFYAFPLHPTGRPGTERADHLAGVPVPMLFLQGTRDTLADLPLLTPVVEKLGASMYVVEDADHSFHVRKSSGKTDAEVVQEMAQTVRTWADGLP